MYALPLPLFVRRTLPTWLLRMLDRRGGWLYVNAADRLRRALLEVARVIVQLAAQLPSGVPPDSGPAVESPPRCVAEIAKPEIVGAAERLIEAAQTHVLAVGGKPKGLSCSVPSADDIDLTCRVLPSPSRSTDRPVRIFVDGVFDLMHFGHMNAFRQARALGGHLVVGVNSDESVRVCKGTVPVLTDSERQVAVSACRFVDEIVPECPYVMTAEYIDYLMREKGIDYFVHGDDPCIVDGKNVYEAAIKAGRFKTIPRTEGISTTDIVGRLLTLTKDHHTPLIDDAASEERSSPSKTGVFLSSQSRFLVTSQLMQAFSAALPKHGAKRGRVVYVDGAWDMFHEGHITLLEKAKKLGDHLVVGVHGDAVVNRHRGSNFPIMAMQERVLSVLGCRYTDDVLLDAPWDITREMIATLQISVVVRGTCCDGWGENASADPHAVPIQMGIHTELKSESPLTMSELVQRLLVRREDVDKRIQVKKQKEQDWFNEKHGLQRPA
eukprot:TRINITY_DN20776_c0_g1_i1.p1 TRINITY_DN20776_c0_g1~~TRINITY_DN20776_c0_g1_i1.p1  ORF type:complete len:495 (+),score=101.43 TRINITY_DN20776_c0_g1_i1:146-1630(+)